MDKKLLRCVPSTVSVSQCMPRTLGGSKAKYFMKSVRS
jgi:hypothetical protein